MDIVRNFGILITIENSTPKKKSNSISFLNVDWTVHLVLLLLPRCCVMSARNIYILYISVLNLILINKTCQTGCRKKICLIWSILL